MDEKENIIKLAENLAGLELTLIQSKGLDENVIKPTEKQCHLMNQIEKTKEQLTNKGAVIKDNGFERSTVEYKGKTISVISYVRLNPKEYIQFDFK